MRAATKAFYQFIFLQVISIHAAHAGSDRGKRCAGFGECISIHAAHAGSDGAFVKIGVLEDVISIHAAHAGSDEALTKAKQQSAISIHAAHAGSDDQPPTAAQIDTIFQSTLPMRAATVEKGRASDSFKNFNPRCPCGQRPAVRR